ncbi:hypothetical protein ACCH40_002448 [Salmonella enterica]
MKTLIDTTCPHCGHDIAIASIRYDVFSDTPLQDTGYVCTHCWKASKVSVANKRKERHVSFVPTDEKCEAVWSIVFSDKNRPMNPFIASTTMPIDLDRFMSELTLGTVEHVNEIGELYIAQSLNQGHLSANGILCIEGDNTDEALAKYRSQLTIPMRYIPDIRDAASFATDLVWLFNAVIRQANDGTLLQRVDGKIGWCHSVRSAVVIDYLLRNRWIAQLFNYWYQYVLDYDIEPILYSADGSVWLSHGFVEGLDVDEPLFLYPKGFRELSFSEAEELMGQDNPANHHEENARRFSPDRKATNLSMDNAVAVPANRVLH